MAEHRRSSPSISSGSSSPNNIEEEVGEIEEAEVMSEGSVSSVSTVSSSPKSPDAAAGSEDMFIEDSDLLEADLQLHDDQDAMSSERSHDDVEIVIDANLRRSRKRSYPLDPMSREILNLQFINPGDQIPDPFEIMKESTTTNGRILRRRKDISKTDELTHDENGMLFDSRTGERIRMCDCLKTECPGCQEECDECGKNFCKVICQKNRAALVWVESTNGVKVRNPLIRQNDYEVDDFPDYPLPLFVYM